MYNLDIDATQILVEARFIEINITDLSELGVNLSLDSPWAITKQTLNGTENGAVTQVGPLTASKFSTFTGAPDEGLNITYQGILTRPQFSAVLHALEKKSKKLSLTSS